MSVFSAEGCFGVCVPSGAKSLAKTSGTGLSDHVRRTVRFLCYVAVVFVIIGKSALAADTLIISEFRLRGPNGANDEFVEIYNYGDASVTVATSDGSSGYALAASNGVARFVIPNGTVIPARGHYLGTNSVGYSLGSYPAGSGTTATGNATYTSDIPDNAGIALFKTATSANFTLANRLDAVGSTSEANTLYKEGSGYQALTPFSIDYSFTRDECGNGGVINTSIPCTRSTPKDTDSNAADFIFVDTNGTSAGAGQRLGAPGPENLSSPVRGIKPIANTALDSCVAVSSAPNRVRDFTSDPANNSTFGTIELRRSFTNNTGAPLTRLRFNIINLTTFPAASGTADLRPRNSSDVVVTVDRPPCGSGTSNVTVRGTTLEQPPSQPNGGGFNSTLSAGTVTLGTPLAAGASIDVRFLFGLQQTGTYRVAINTESLPGGGNLWTVEGNTESGGEVEGVSVPATAGDLIISEFRLRGPNGANDEFVEIYNPLSTSAEVFASDGSSGYALAASNGVARFVIPNGTVIPARGHYLGTNSVGYSLGSYPAGSGTTATGNATYTSDIPDNAGIALFKTATSANFTLANRLDAVGSTSEANTLYKEGSGYQALTPFSIDYSFARDECGNGGAINTAIPCTRSTPKDTNNNSADFIFVDTNGTSAGAGQRLGAPGPENLASPRTGNSSLSLSLLDSSVAESVSPNAVRNFTSDPANNSTFGTVAYRLRVTNNTSVPVTRLRLRVIDLTTFPAPSGISDLRPRNSGSEFVSNINDPATCSPAAAPCSLTVQGTTLEQPPSQPNGGGFNSSMAVGNVALAAPLSAGASVNVQILNGLQQTGCTRLGVIAEALPGGSSDFTMLQGGSADINKCITSIMGSYAGGNGSITCSRFPTYNSSSTCTMIPGSGWYLSSLTDNGADVLGFATFANGQWSYTINNVTTDHDVQSGFAEYKARRSYGPTGFEFADTILGIYSSPSSNDFTIELRELTFPEAVSFNQPYTIQLSGGWSSNFGSNNGTYSIIKGKLTIRNGRVQLQNIKIR